jgi:hypothetical protein
MKEPLRIFLARRMTAATHAAIPACSSEVSAAFSPKKARVNRCFDATS